MPGKAATRNNKGNNNNTKKAKKPSAKELYAASLAKKAAATPAPAPAAAAKTSAEKVRNARNAARLEKELKKKTHVTKGPSLAAKHKAMFVKAIEATAGHGSL
jgi:hypothetical protein